MPIVVIDIKQAVVIALLDRLQVIIIGRCASHTGHSRLEVDFTLFEGLTYTNKLRDLARLHIIVLSLINHSTVTDDCLIGVKNVTLSTRNIQSTILCNGQIAIDPHLRTSGIRVHSTRTLCTGASDISHRTVMVRIRKGISQPFLGTVEVNRCTQFQGCTAVNDNLRARKQTNTLRNIDGRAFFCPQRHVIGDIEDCLATFDGIIN